MKLRTRIALALAASLLLAGAVVLAVSAFTYQRAVYDSPAQQVDKMLERLGSNRTQALAYIREHPEAVLGDDGSGGTPGGSAVDEAFQEVQREAQEDAVRQARLWSAVALAAMAVVAGLVGWLIAGRTLRPLRAITTRAREASATDLHARVALGGPHDEVRELGDTFDEMLARLEQSFATQRRFSAQVSHEIRTPLAVIAGETDLLLRDPRPEDVHSLEQIRGATDRAAGIVSALLVLGRSGSGDLKVEDVDLDRVAGDVLGELVHEPAWRQVRVELALDPAPVRADRALLERMVANLLTNAARHNRPGGWVEVATRAEAAGSVLEVSNSVPDGAGDDREPRRGIGLTIVESVVAAHGGELRWDHCDPGVVRVEVRLPRPVDADRALTAALAAPP